MWVSWSRVYVLLYDGWEWMGGVSGWVDGWMSDGGNNQGSAKEHQGREREESIIHTDRITPCSNLYPNAPSDRPVLACIISPLSAPLHRLAIPVRPPDEWGESSSLTYGMSGLTGCISGHAQRPHIKSMSP